MCSHLLIPQALPGLPSTPTLFSAMSLQPLTPVSLISLLLLSGPYSFLPLCLGCPPHCLHFIHLTKSLFPHRLFRAALPNSLGEIRPQFALQVSFSALDKMGMWGSCLLAWTRNVFVPQSQM